LTALRHFFAGHEAQLRQHSRTQPVESPAAKGPRISGWRFNEARFAVSQGPDSRAKSLMLKIVEFLEGNAALEELAAASTE